MILVHETERRTDSTRLRNGEGGRHGDARPLPRRTPGWWCTKKLTLECYDPVYGPGLFQPVRRVPPPSRGGRAGEAGGSWRGKKSLYRATVSCVPFIAKLLRLRFFRKNCDISGLLVRNWPEFYLHIFLFLSFISSVKFFFFLRNLNIRITIIRFL